MKAYQPTTIKLHNQAVLLDLLKQQQAPMTKRQLADASQLSVVTINKLLPELIEKQLLLTTDQPQRTGGRQAAAYQYNAQRTLLLIIQFIEEDQQIVIRFSVVDLVGNILHHEQSAEGRLPQFLQAIRQIKQEYPKISLAVVGIPGVEIAGRLKIMDAPAFKDMALGELIEKEIAVKTLIENDVNAAVFHFKEEKKIVAGIYFPKNYPPGAGLVIDQQLFKGANHLSGEIKHLPHLYTASYPLATEAIPEQVTATLQAIVAVTDPHQVILFLPSEWQALVSRSFLEKQLAAVFQYGVLPKLHFSDRFSENYLAGLITMGIEAAGLGL
ncbi:MULTISPECIES: ROK family protein [Enterococcus]|uniref:ROK family protein n=1 Tax=Enterococcus casseliflavus TaxID=37734 RepID=A0ABD6Z3C8_ENTCA|nr:ROK family protein [Enterococcus casseliflavus]EOH76340.1 hypothetical protein UAM_03239 [Enterococcus casseliflavus ATCC 49996]EOU05197.1 hypothetical protein I582_02724 [Enterococcus casseliflavus ATCC 49996]MBE9880594.1 ROK family protein [Enterococcus casseliflavus]MDT2974203.1 ROK family protein [Enterococcus casseliflavus]QGN30509.1 ROK family protein [Enterococcus casseliflavus]